MKFNLLTRVLLLTLALHSPAAAQMTRIAVGYSGISADQLVIWIARDAGIFAKNNLDFRRCTFPVGRFRSRR